MKSRFKSPDPVEHSARARARGRFKNMAAQVSFFALSFICKGLSGLFLCTFLALLALLFWGKCQLCHAAALLLHLAALALIELCDLCQLCSRYKRKFENE